MKTKFSKVIGVAFALMLVASMLVFALPAAAGPYSNLNPAPNMWKGYTPTTGLTGGYFLDDGVTAVGPIAEAIDGDLYAYVAGLDDLAKSTNGGRTWSFSTSPSKYAGDAIVDMVCSSLSEDVLYVTDGNYVYKSVDGGMSFMFVAQASLEYALMGKCGVAVANNPITCIDVAYDGANAPVVFIGTMNAGNVYDDDYPDYPGFDVVGSVYWIADETFPAEWADLQLRCYGCCNDAWQADGTSTGCFDVFSVGCAPDFATTSKVYALISTLDDNCAAADGVPSTQVVSSVGTTCSWGFVGELFYDCDAANYFGITHGSRFAFPDDFADTHAMFIGVTAWDGATTETKGGDVYSLVDSIPATPVLDLNVQGYSSGCTGYYEANICSLDIMGGTDDGSLIAGAYDTYENQAGTEVYYSTDGGWTWDDSDKDPTGIDMTYVLWYGDSALAATSGCECAVSMSCGDEVGKYWNQISLINTNIDTVLDLSHAPGYLDGSTTMFVLTVSAVDGCNASNSLFRWDGTYWERVYCSASPEYATAVQWVEVSPDFNDTDCLYIANTGFQMFRSIDQGCSWRMLAYPCDPLPSISAWIVVDEETVLTAGAGETYAGNIYRTTRHGTRPWSAFPVLNSTGAAAGDGVDFDLSLPRGATSDVLFGDDEGQVYLSQDLGETWAEIEDAVTGGFNYTADGGRDTYVVFDPGYGTAGDAGENMIYAAAGTDAGRCDIDFDALMVKQDWLYMKTNICDASGIDIEGDPVLYVADAGQGGGTPASVTVSGTAMVECVGCVYGDCAGDFRFTSQDITTTSGSFIDDELVEIISQNLICTTTCTEGTPDSCAFTIYGEIDIRGYSSGAVGFITIPLGAPITPEVWSCTSCDCTETASCTSNAAIISGHLQITSTAGTSACPTGVWRSLNPTALVSEVSGLNLTEWELLTKGGTSVLAHVPATHFAVNPDDLWLTKGSNVLWTLDLVNSTTIWMWEDPLATPVIQIAPADGALLASTSTVTLEWEALDGGTSYEVYIYSYCPTCPDNMVLFDNFETTDTCIVITGLTPGMTYYWKVRVAEGAPFMSKWSTLRSFDTALGAVPYLCSPICGASNIIITTNFSWDAVAGADGYEVQIATDEAFASIVSEGTATVNAWVPASALDYSTVYYWRVRAVNDGVSSAWATCIFTTADAPVTPEEPVEPVEIIQNEITPTWIWVLIGIGGALTIAVIILIVTTRRAP